MEGNTPETLPQPDSASQLTNIGSVGNQMDVFQNIPAVSGGSDILRVLGQLADAVAQLRAEMQANMATMPADITALRTEMKILDRNQMSRLINSTAVTKEMVLAPMFNTTTGQRVDRCPVTLDELERCDDRLIDERMTALLHELGDEEVPQALEDKRMRLRATFGLVGPLYRPTQG
ncbi:hypothetical protein E4U21_004446 [Claviceps maximensis]|nr:hypothetical protein E4U21_004446 [Claviceps maximensis]